MTINIKNTDQTQALVNYQRSDRFFRAKNIDGSNFRKLFIGLGLEIGRAEGKLQEITNELDLENTNNLISEWEKAIGIPDACIPLQKDLDERRNNVIMKLVSLGVSTKEGFENLAAILGFNVTVLPGIDKLVFPFAFPFLLVNENARWIMYVEAPATISTSVFPYTFPFEFGTDLTLILRCLFQALVPSPVKVIFNFV